MIIFNSHPIMNDSNFNKHSLDAINFLNQCAIWSDHRSKIQLYPSSRGRFVFIGYCQFVIFLLCFVIIAR